MAERGMTAAARAEAAKAQNQPLHLLEVHFDTGVLRVSDHFRAVNWDGNTYQALGTLLSFSGIRESAELRVFDLTVQLSGVDQTMIASVLVEDYIDRRLVIYKGFQNDRGEVIVDPVAIFDGRMDAPVIEEDPESGKCVVAVTAGSHFVDFERTPGRRTNSAIQETFFPGDRFFDAVSEVNREITWGPQ